MDEIRVGGRLVAIPKLLDMILLHLSMQDLLVRAQRVNKTFKCTIDESKQLQRKLFFLPGSASGENRVNELFLRPSFFNKQRPNSCAEGLQFGMPYETELEEHHIPGSRYVARRTFWIRKKIHLRLSKVEVEEDKNSVIFHFTYDRCKCRWECDTEEERRGNICN